MTDPPNIAIDMDRKCDKCKKLGATVKKPHLCMACLREEVAKGIARK